MKASPKKNLRAFTFLELLFAVFIFSLLMVAASGIFAQAFGGYREAKQIQEDVENAQFLLDQMAKELRTSTIVKINTSGSYTQSVQYYDYSQSRCLLYRLSGGTLYKAAYNPNRPDPDQAVAACDSHNFPVGALEAVSTGTVNGTFYIVTSNNSPQQIGRITIGLTISRDPSHTAHIQSSVALRDFGYIGLPD
jgi:type II secretory pathway pseudopilin PulG